MLFHTMNVMCHTTQCDFNNDLRASGIVDILQDAARIHCDILGYDEKKMKELGYYWVLTYECYEVVSRMPKSGEIIKVNTWPHPKRKLEYDREIEIRDLNDNLLIKAYTNWVIIDREKRRISKALEVVIDGDFKLDGNYNEPCKRKLNLGDYPLLDSYEYKVKLSDLDSNIHVNNAKYLDFIMNSMTIDSYKAFKKIELSFVKEARLDDIITINHYKNEEGLDCYKGFVNNELCFEAIITF